MRTMGAVGLAALVACGTPTVPVVDAASDARPDVIHGAPSGDVVRGMMFDAATHAGPH